MTEVEFMPISKSDLDDRGIEQLDFVLVSGDAYVDHPSFANAVIGRVLESAGYTVGIISQPDWKNKESVKELGKPRLAFLISGGNMDSMVNHYYVSGKRRQTDAYTAGGMAGKRPDRACIAYGNLIRTAFPNIPIIIGGIEASLRRLAHYDYWSDSLRRSALLDSRADLIVYGMGERAITEIADALNAGLSVSDITFIKGTVYKRKDLSHAADYIILPSYDNMKEEKRLYAESFKTQYLNTDAITASTLVEPYPNGVFVIQNPPSPPLSQSEMDGVYALPFVGDIHSSYVSLGGVPAVSEVKFSLISSRGCFGGCNFCALTFHQGRVVQARSHESIINEAKRLIKMPEFKGYIHDVGGPTANFRHTSCEEQKTRGVCKNKQCMFPKPCDKINTDHGDYIELLSKLRALDGVKKVFIRSGIRFDYMLEADKKRAKRDKGGGFFRELVEHHISGQLKVAPEHVSDTVLSKMGKPPHSVYTAFLDKYKRLNEKLGKNQFIVPYFMSSHPGSGIKEAIELAEYLRDIGSSPEQVQDFYPTPSTVSTVMYYTGIDPLTGKEVYVPRTKHEKAMQRALIQYRNPANYKLVEEALIKAGRKDLIGFEKKCLIRPLRVKQEGAGYDNGHRKKNNGAKKNVKKRIKK